MAHPEYIRQKAIQLREDRGLTIDEIAERLALSKTTIYYWVKDMPIARKPGRGFRSEAQKRGTEAMQAKFKAIRDDAYQQGLDEFAEMCADPTFRDLVCMYIGEGYKRNRNEVCICNSDPAVVKLGADWIEKLTINKVDYAIQYHADQSIEELREFWSSHLGIEPDRIRAQRKSNSNQLQGRNWRSVHGVLTVRTGDTRFRARMQAWMDSVRAEWQ